VMLTLNFRRPVMRFLLAFWVLKLGSPVAWQVASPVLPPVRSVAGWRDVRLPGVVNPAGKVPAEVASLRSAFEHQASWFRELVRSRASSCHFGTPGVTPGLALCFKVGSKAVWSPLSRSRRPLVLGWLSGRTIDVVAGCTPRDWLVALWVVVRVRDLRSRWRFSALTGHQTLRSSGRSCKDRPQLAAAVPCVVLPLLQAFIGCTPGLFPLEVHRTFAYRRGGQRAGGSVLLERCVMRRRRRSAPCHSKGAHAAERVRGLVAQGDRGLVLDAPASAALRCGGWVRGSHEAVAHIGGSLWFAAVTSAAGMVEGSA